MLELKIKTPNSQELRSFALTISVALGIVGALVLWRRGPIGFIFIATGAVILLAGLLWPKSLFVLYKAMSKLSIMMEFWQFLKVRKKYWLLPIVIVLLALGTLLILTEGSALAPFIYALF